MNPADVGWPVMELFGPTLQGEGRDIGRPCYFIRFGLCDAHCTHCIEASQRVLMADWSLRPISSVRPGDRVMGVWETPGHRNHKQIRPTEVLHAVCRGRRGVVEVATSVGGRDKKGPFKGLRPTKLVCTPDHKLLNAKWRTYWQPASSCGEGVLRAVSVSDTPDDLTSDFWVGWVHGVFAGDGNIHKFQGAWWRMKVSCEDADLIDQAVKVLEALGMPVRRTDHDSGRGRGKLPCAEVTCHKKVEAFKSDMEKGTDSFDYMRGWLAGFFDTDGHYDAHTESVRISQNAKVNAAKVAKAEKCLKALGFRYNLQTHASSASSLNPGAPMTCIIISGCLEFFTTCRPFLARKHPIDLRMGKMPRAPVSTITPLEDPAEVWDLTTTAGNFIAEGVVVHNCDSMFAVDPVLVHSNAENLNTAEIIDRLKALPGECRWVVLTGGNPALWDLEHLVDQLHLAEYQVAVETQGSFWRDWLRKCDLVTVSPKPPSMYNTDMGKLVKFMGKLSLAAVIKVPVFNLQEDLEFARTIRRMFPVQAFYISLGNHHIQPPVETESDVPPIGLGALRQILLDDFRHMAEVITKDPDFRTTTILPQLHVLMYGNERGR